MLQLNKKERRKKHLTRNGYMIRFTAYLLAKEYIIAFLILCLLLMTGSAYTAEDPCCCEQDTGNIDGDAIGNIDIADLTLLIDHLFINFPSLDCTGKANVDGDTQGTIDIADLTFLIDHLFINFPSLPCPNSGNVDADAGVDIADLTLLIDHLFINFPSLPACQ